MNQTTFYHQPNNDLLAQAGDRPEIWPKNANFGLA